MNIFNEYLADWEFDQRWRGLIVRLSEILEASSGTKRRILEDCAVFDVPPLHGTVNPLTIWVDVPGPGPVALTLAGFFEEYGMRCGPINPHSVDPIGSYEDLTWEYLALTQDMDPAELAEPFADWLTSTAQRPLDELIELNAARRERKARRTP
jgi:hypothetical protein